ncbi:MAG: MCE family protein [Acidobacteria bacterium]|nr:MCE family protein [Acidobacteriota bacterium]
MDRRKRLAWSKLKVGIFVLVALIVAAVGVLSIGTVSIFTPKVRARTYLAGVSGLKEGDIVLLQGVEVGNVSEVTITGEPPPTDINRQAAQSITESTRKLESLRASLAQRRNQLQSLREEYQRLLPRDPTRARIMEVQIERTQRLVDAEMRELENARASLDNAKSSLQNIEVTMVIEEKYQSRIKRDSTTSLGSIGLMGDKYIEISLGRTGDPPEKDKDGVIVIAGSRVTDFREIMIGVDDVIANFGVLSQRMENIMAKFDEGQGSIGRFINDAAFYNNLNDTILETKKTVASASSLLKDVQGGQGTIGKLMSDSRVYDTLAVTTQKLETLASRLNSKEGSLGKLINDPEIHDKTSQLLSDVDSITGRINRGEGTLGKLSADDALYQDLQVSVQKLNALLDDINQGKGTLGRLAKDQQMYNNLNEASSEFVKLLYDFRKNPKKYLTINFRIF